MKRIVLVSLLCFSFVASRAQGVWQITNTSSCDMDVTFLAIDMTTCAVVATSVINPYLVGAGTVPPGWIVPPVVWTPALPAGNYFMVAKVSYAWCPGSPSVIVGAAGGCAMPHGSLPAACNCGPVQMDFLSGVFPVPTPPGFYFPALNIF